MARIKILPVLLSLSFLGASAQAPSITGRWIISTNYLGTPLTPLLNLEQTGEKLTATGRGYKYVGALHGTALHLTATDEQGNTDEIVATLADGKMEGVDTETDANDKAHRLLLNSRQFWRLLWNILSQKPMNSRQRSSIVRCRPSTNRSSLSILEIPFAPPLWMPAERI